MRIYAAIFVVSIMSAFGLTPLVRWGARKLGIVDAPDGFRKVQPRPIPRMGGVAIFIAFFASLGACAFLFGTPELTETLCRPDFFFLLGGAVAVLLVGLWDDVRGLRARWKLLTVSLVAVVMHVGGYGISAVSNPFGSAINLGWLAVPVTLFWFLGCVNAINFIDGLDGLASGVAVFVAATMFLTSVLFHNMAGAILCVALAGSVLGFLLFNLHPASIFLGDSGSYLLGFLIASIGLRSSQKSNMVVALLIPVIALGLPIMDTALAILRRWSRALPFSASDRQHVHHKLLDWGLSHRQAVLVMYAGCLVLAGFALLMSAANNRQAAGLLGALGVGTLAAVRVVGRSEIEFAKKRVADGFRGRRRSAELRRAAHQAVEMMRHADAISSIWDIFSGTAQTLELDRAVMILREGSVESERGVRSFRWERDASDTGEDEDGAKWSVVLPLIQEQVRLGELEVSVATNGLPMSPELPTLLMLFSKAIAQNTSRLEANATPAAPSNVESSLG